MNVLVVDVGGTHVKILATGQKESREFPSGPTLTAKQMVAGVKKLAGDWKYDAVSIGYPGPVINNRPLAEPHNLGRGWIGFDFKAAFKRPGKSRERCRDASFRELQGWKDAFPGFRNRSRFRHDRGRHRRTHGAWPSALQKTHLRRLCRGPRIRTRWAKRNGGRHVADVVARLIAALEPDDVVLGGGNVKKLKELPPGCRAGNNANAFVGGFRLWQKTSGAIPRIRKTSSQDRKTGECFNCAQNLQTECDQRRMKGTQR